MIALDYLYYPFIFIYISQKLYELKNIFLGLPFLPMKIWERDGLKKAAPPPPPAKNL